MLIHSDASILSNPQSPNSEMTSQMAATNTNGAAAGCASNAAKESAQIAPLMENRYPNTLHLSITIMLHKSEHHTDIDFLLVHLRNENPQSTSLLVIGERG